MRRLFCGSRSCDDSRPIRGVSDEPPFQGQQRSCHRLLSENGLPRIIDGAHLPGANGKLKSRQAIGDLWERFTGQSSESRRLGDFTGALTARIFSFQRVGGNQCHDLLTQSVDIDNQTVNSPDEEEIRD